MLKFSFAAGTVLINIAKIGLKMDKQTLLKIIAIIFIVLSVVFTLILPSDKIHYAILLSGNLLLIFTLIKQLWVKQ